MQFLCPKEETCGPPPTSPTQKYLSPSMARAEQLLGVAEKTLLECQ